MRCKESVSVSQLDRDPMVGFKFLKSEIWKTLSSFVSSALSVPLTESYKGFCSRAHVSEVLGTV